MNHTIGLDADTLFLANAIILGVMALAFTAAWRKQKHECCWLSWIGANVTLAVALVGYMALPLDRGGLGAALPNALLVAGFGLRWRAARQFARRRTSWVNIALPTLVTLVIFCFPRLFEPRTAFVAVNIILAVQSGAVAWLFFSDDEKGLPSRYGLVFAYAIIGLSFAARVGQGVASGGAMASYLPLDTMLVLHLLVAVIHTCASGAFILSIGYERMAKELRHAAMSDPLTGLPNRRSFEITARRLLAGTDGREHAFVLFDIDHFKQINDRFGHAAGDTALARCAEICAATLRKGDFLARVGGEEFAAILSNVSEAEAVRLAERVRTTLAGSAIEIEECSVSLTISAGVSHCRAGTGDFEMLMRCIDRGLYRAKDAGRNRIIQATAPAVA